MSKDPAGGGKAAVLVLEDGTVFRGAGFGAAGEAAGEVVFNTGMTGYQETLTDPSYCGQIVVMTAPHVGNTGVNDEDPESGNVWVAGYVVREPARLASSWRATATLDDYLAAHGVPGIALPDTRALTIRIREHGAMRAVISAAGGDPVTLLARARQSPQMAGTDYATTVTTRQPYTVTPPAGTATRWKVAALDLGIKANTPREMARRGIEVTVWPAATPASELLAASPDGVFISNGPGDPAALDYAVTAVQGVLDRGTPLFGICFGSQILSRALGLGTYKLRYGHRGVNQPVMDLATGRVYITSHNHGFAAALPGAAGAQAQDQDQDQAAAAPAGGAGASTWAHVPEAARKPFDTPYGPAQVSHVNLNDGVVEGIRLLEYPAFSVQYHPEAAPGPHDAADHFDQFVTLMERAHAQAG